MVINRDDHTVTFTDSAMNGTAGYYMGSDTAEAQKLFALRYGRSCPEDQLLGCVAITYDQVPEGDNVSWAERIYLQANSSTGPDPTEIIAPILLTFEL